MTPTTPSENPAVADELVAVLRDDLDLRCESVSAGTRLVDDLGMDSVAFAVGLVSIEERFGVQLDEQDLLACSTVGDLQCAIDQKAAA
ncbi:acyl carrier protein [Candidatus Mycobacterium wuenschmannii]|uniref:Acyl carrier protein n=1 Tax=Candidatus Mycobacterium wuenschmannii TaxID=3027808 RepID=A0ABY8W1E1_9MYCO|nr:acyl carrier protein [Candidatus Mycobacterium wuenschmannii]WIM89386.1 acyl carrier protein [Candidatus Mycobacterium wuenschmannii]